MFSLLPVPAIACTSYHQKQKRGHTAKKQRVQTIYFCSDADYYFLLTMQYYTVLHNLILDISIMREACVSPYKATSQFRLLFYPFLNQLNTYFTEPLD